MKVIELLNLISRDRELPNKIKYNGYIFEYDINHKRYEAYFDEQIWVLQDFISIDDDLNNEVEILEPQEHKIPDKIFLNQTDGNCYIDPYSYKQVPLKREKLSPEEVSIINKINEILDYLEVNKNE